MRATLLLAGALAATLLTPPLHGQEGARVHELIASPRTVHRSFLDASLEPVLTIASGDRVWLATATGNPRYFEQLGVPPELIPEELYAAFADVDNAGRGDHTLNGPIHVAGAEPGDMLEVRILSVDLRFPIAGQGFSADRGTLPGEFAAGKQRVIWLDLEKRTAEYAPGIEVPLEPFWGLIAVAPPPAMGRVPSGPPDVFGGNMDNSDLVGGTTLYLPVFVPGALLSIGDGHAAQGHGEVGGGAIETSLRGEIQVVLHKNRPLRGPRAETPTHYMTMGMNVDLDVAVKDATRDMLDWITEMHEISREDAYLLASSAMDLIVTQVVDGTKGIHALLPKAIFKGGAAAWPLR